MGNNITIRILGDETLFNNSSVKNFIQESPYHGFVLLCNMLEFLTRCYYKYSLEEWELTSKTAKVNDYLAQSKSLQKYSTIKDKDEKTISLYKTLRCGMMHTFTPGKLKLTNDKNDLDQQTIGAKELYDDLNQAWSEITSNSDLFGFLDNEILTINK